ncbi:MAG: sugar phosphate isomerase/epimerase [Firmicutes bacterium]|nr:sugar phosphate isomerase/epimerase [[Eubacterium] siraeum]MCM1487998.1 sugar phosphate isomerase/epimerase [Bacillota bacterium]
MNNMKLFIRAHDLGVKGEDNVVKRLDELGLNGVQLVAYKVLEDVSYTPGSITSQRAEELSGVFKMAGKTIPLIGAYFNPVHPNEEKIKNGIAVFKDYLSVANTLDCGIVGSETGSFNGDKWTYHPQNRTDEALKRVISTFSELCRYAEDNNAYVGMEGAFGHVCYDVKTLDKAIKAIGSDNIKVIFDLYNYLDKSNADKMYDILSEGLQTFGDRICVFHIKDCVISEDGTLKQCGVGKGIFDYAKILGEINRVCPDANLVFEGTTGEDIPYAVSHIKGVLETV